MSSALEKYRARKAQQQAPQSIGQAVSRVNNFKKNTQQQTQQANQGKFAEKRVVGWENPMRPLYWVILYREVPFLQPESYYAKPLERDEEGFTVGVVRQAIFRDEQSFNACLQEMLDKGWKEERRKA